MKKFIYIKRTNVYCNKYYKKLKHKFKWIISVDVDEFITTKNVTHTIKDELNIIYSKMLTYKNTVGYDVL